MKLSDIILEFRDPLVNRFDSYGAWIHPGGKILPVKGKNGHAAFLAQNLDILGLGPEIFQSEDPAAYDMHRIAFEKGFVRVAHERPEEVVFQGLAPALQKNAYLINNVAAQEDVKLIVIDKMQSPESEGTLTGSMKGERFLVSFVARIVPALEILIFTSKRFIRRFVVWNVVCCFRIIQLSVNTKCFNIKTHS